VSARLTNAGADLKPAPTGGWRRHGLPEIIRGFKTFSARRINQIYNRQGKKLWHRNYYEHVIRNDRSLLAIQEYIVNDSTKWEMDRATPNR